ncbi:lipid-A-disaccharide synthase [Halarsenatibacter silvermanii]|uniref:Lipid-A-disaccharide synthase n=1 Tax=Halarsenatibacter silvermanii TaxID=321763 RepID=A0A1G9HTZ2_9FIRM|nr:lipid-A-disaccharide synthase [Halarsenatibacter silvermanii]SDL16043.1 lipid-A-disaccharide synthase [Halarsenatibacter silvermanii]
MQELMIVAGEPSGDMHAARVAKKIRNRVSPLRISGMGGRELARLGQKQVVKTEGENSFGLAGAIAGLPGHLSRAHRLLQAAEENEPRAALLVDYSGFNMYLARGLRRRDIPAVHYIPPSAWSWGRWRARWLARQQVKVAAIFPQEYEVYKKVGADVEYVGHPLRDEITSAYDHRRCRDQLEEVIKNKGRPRLKSGEKVLALLPGSRKREIDSLLEPMLAAARRLQDDHYLRPVVAVRSEDSNLVRERLNDSLTDEVEIIAGHTRRVMGAADLGIISSGTATLEAALIGCPQLVVYRADRITAAAARILLRTDHVSLPNIILGREVVPELVQKEVSDDTIYERAGKLLLDDQANFAQQQGYREVREKVGSPGAAERAAELVIKTGGFPASFTGEE